MWNSLDGRVLDKIQFQILRALKSKSRTEKELSKIIGLDVYPLSSIISDLMLQGYVDTLTRRSFRFFVKKLCVITPMGLGALEQASSPLEKFVEQVKERALLVLDSFLQPSAALRLVAGSGKLAYKFLR